MPSSPAASRPRASLASRLGVLALAVAVASVATTIQQAGGRADRTGRKAAAADLPAVPGWSDLKPVGTWSLLKTVFEKFGQDRIQAVAAGVTFYGLLALFPAIAAFVSLYGLVSDPATLNEQLAALKGVLPGGAIDIVGDQIKRLTSSRSSALGFAFFSGLAISLWSANAGMKAIFDALNVAYEEDEKRNFIVLNLWSLGFTIGAVLFLAVLIGVVVVVPVVLKFIGLGAVTDWLLWAGRWPAMLLFVLLALSVLYRFGPDRPKARWRWYTPGGLLGAIGWLAFSMLFSWYVSSFGSYNETYGSLGAAIGFLTWVWLSTTIILVGAVLNATLEQRTSQAAAVRKGPTDRTVSAPAK